MRRGRVKKQVQRFRLFGYDDQGRVVREIDAAQVKWSVHVANTKATWYGFINALDQGAGGAGHAGRAAQRLHRARQARRSAGASIPAWWRSPAPSTNGQGGDDKYA